MRSQDSLAKGKGGRGYGHLVSLVTWTLPQAAIEQNNDNNAPFYCFIIIILAPTITSEANTKLFLGKEYEGLYRASKFDIGLSVGQLQSKYTFKCT